MCKKNFKKRINFGLTTGMTCFLVFSEMDEFACKDIKGDIDLPVASLVWAIQAVC